MPRKLRKKRARRRYANKGAMLLVERTQRYIKAGLGTSKAFAMACEYENYDGVRPDVVRDRQMAAAVLRQRGRRVPSRVVADISRTLFKVTKEDYKRLMDK